MEFSSRFNNFGSRVFFSKLNQYFLQENNTFLNKIIFNQWIAQRFYFTNSNQKKMNSFNNNLINKYNINCIYRFSNLINENKYTIYNLNFGANQNRFSSIYSRGRQSVVIRSPTPEALDKSSTLVPTPESSTSSQIMQDDPNISASYTAFKSMNIEPFRRSDMRITGRRTTGFVINDKYTTLGSICIFKSGGYLLWKEKHHSLLTIDSFKILEYLNPTPRIVVLGMGNEAYKLNPEIKSYYEKTLGITFEVLSSKDAVGIWNVLSGEDRDVIGFLITDKPINQDKMHPAINPKFRDQIMMLAKNTSS